MSILETMTIKQILSQRPADHVKELLSFLPREMQDLYPKLPSPSGIFTEAFTKRELLQFIHPSWIDALLSHLPKEDQNLFYSALEEENPSKLSDSLRSYLIDGLYNALLSSVDDKTKPTFWEKPPRENIPPPIQLLTADPLLELLKGDHKKLDTLIFFLGLFDLTTEIKKIIYKKTLGLIEQALTEKEIAFMTHLRKTGMIVSIGDMGLSHYRGNKEALRNVVRERGLFRFGKASASASKGLLWYLMHALDKKTAQEIKTFLSPIKDAKVESKLKSQIMNTWDWLCTSSHS